MIDDARDDTVLTHAGRDPKSNFGIVNPPVYHASTILFPTVAELEKITDDKFDGVTYGRYGTPIHFALEEAVAELEGADRAILTPSGLAAVTATLMALVDAGDHILAPDSVYGPVRAFCQGFLKRFNVETTFYDPLIGGGIESLIQDNTRLIYTESPGSLTFEVQDIPAIAAAAHRRDLFVVMDNTWASPLFFKPFKFGVDVSIHAATKYICGHSDAMLGVITTTEPLWRQLKGSAATIGHSVGPDDVYLALRGLRTLGARLRAHESAAFTIATWLDQRPEVARVLSPALPADPGHAIWRRDFRGATGLFGVVLNPVPEQALHAMLDNMRLFKMGYSWGGYESLILPTKPWELRSATEWSAPGPTLRLHIGLEDVDDLVADLEAGFGRLAEAAARHA